MSECVDNLNKFSNKELLRIENDVCVHNDISKLLLITKKSKKTAIKKPTFKTEKISSSILNRAKDFLEKTKNEKIDNTCVIDIDSNNAENDNNDDDSHPNLEMNLLVFERENNSDSSDESSNNDSESESSECDSDDDSTSEPKTDCNVNNKTIDTNNDNINNELH